MMTETGASAAAPAAMIGGTRYDPVTDFTQIGIVSTPPGVLVVTEAIARAPRRRRCWIPCAAPRRTS